MALPPTVPKGERRLIWQAAVIVAVGGWVFSASCRHGGWLWDDDLYVYQNVSLRSLSGLWQNWFSPAGVNYFPVMATVQWIQWHLWGPHAEGYRWTNLALHLFSCLLLWRILFKLGVRLAWLGGLLFAVHPVVVESVAWVSELKNTLSLPPLLLALSAYIDFDRSREGPAGALRFNRDYGLSVFFFAVAMLSKSTVAMFPFILPLHAWWKRARLDRADFAAAAPFFAISLALGLVTISFEHNRSMLGFTSPSADHFLRLAAAGLSTVFYLAKCCFPLSQLPTYPRWGLGSSALLFLPWFALGGLFFWTWMRRDTWGRHALFGLGWFVLNLIPVLGFVPMAYQRISWVADHFAYLSLCGFAGLAAAALTRLSPRRPARLWPLWTTAVIFGLALKSHSYSAVFQNRPRLWAYTLPRNPSSWSGYDDLGNWMLGHGRVAEAVAEFQRALQIEPDSAAVHNNLGAAYNKLGEVTPAVDQFEAALRLGADYPQIHYNLGIDLARQGRWHDAKEQYETALRQDPSFAEGHVNLGAILAEEGDLPAAVEQFEKGLKLDAKDFDARFDLATALAALDRLSAAVIEFQRLLTADPSYPGARSAYGDALVKVGQVDEAIRQYSLALQSDPNDAAVHYRLGLALRSIGRSDDAAAQFDAAARPASPPP